MATLAMAASGNRDLELALPGIPQDRPQLLELPDVIDPLHPRGGEAGHVGPHQRIVGAEDLPVRDHERTGVDGENERDRYGHRRQASSQPGTFMSGNMNHSIGVDTAVLNNCAESGYLTRLSGCASVLKITCRRSSVPGGAKRR
jgi:hypothetical protein